MKDDLRPTAPSILCVVGARPNLVKMAPIMAALARLAPPPRLWLVHTGQHYGEAMDGQFFRDLALPQPDVNLGVGSGSHAAQTATVMLRFEPVLEQIAPDALLVVGDEGLLKELSGKIAPRRKKPNNRGKRNAIESEKSSRGRRPDAG